MRTTEKIIVAGVIGTTFMTLYPYWKSKQDVRKELGLFSNTS